jgi:HEPN domain-containing protein
MNKELSMDLEKLEKLARLVLKDLSKEYSYMFQNDPHLASEFSNLMAVASQTFPEHQTLFLSAFKNTNRFNSNDAISLIHHLLDILEIEKAGKKDIEQIRIFEGAGEKLKQASLSFKKEDYPSTMNNLNTALELVLKDKLGIPATITGINTSNIIDILTKHKVDPYLYLEEARKHVLVIDNKIKHQGYCPTKIDCINGIKAMEELIAKLRNVDMKLNEEVRNKIYEGL